MNLLLMKDSMELGMFIIQSAVFGTLFILVAAFLVYIVEQHNEKGE